MPAAPVAPPFVPAAPAPAQPAPLPAPAAAPILRAHGAGAPYRIAQARDVWRDQPDVAALLPENMPVKMYDDPDAPAIDSLYRFSGALLRKVLTAMNCAHPMPCWCGGPKGTGKTEFCRQLAARLGRAFFRVGFNRATEPSEILGDMGLADGSTQWVDGPVSQALRTPGAVLLLDEITYAAQGYLAALNPVLECNGAPVRLPRTGERLIPADDCFVLAADNTFGHGDTSGEYTARQPLSADTLNRFRLKLRFDYLPEAEEKAVLVAHVARECGRRLRPGAASAIIKLMQVSRDKGAAGELQGAPSLRDAVAMAILVSAGIPAPEAFDDTITRSAPPESHETLRSIFAAHWPASDPDVAAFIETNRS
jgi:nitric oxide reductase NorQ protein